MKDRALQRSPVISDILCEYDNSIYWAALYCSACSLKSANKTTNCKHLPGWVSKWFASNLPRGNSDAHVLLLHLIFHQVSRTVLNFLCRLKFQIFKEHKTSGYSGFIIYPQYFTPGRPGNTIDSVKQSPAQDWLLGRNPSMADSEKERKGNKNKKRERNIVNWFQIVIFLFVWLGSFIRHCSTMCVPLVWTQF